MKLLNAKYNFSMELRENFVDILVIEKPSLMSELIMDMQKQCDGEEGEWVLAEETKILQINKHICFLLDPFSYDINNRKMLSILYKQLEQQAFDFYEEKGNINSQIISVMDNIIEHMPYSAVSYNLELSWTSLFKLYDMKFDAECNSLLEKLIEVVKILSALHQYDILCLVNIKSYLEAEELMYLYEMAFYNKIYLVLLENTENIANNYENFYIMDKDLCFIRKS